MVVCVIKDTENSPTTNLCRAYLHMHRAPPLAHTHPHTESILFVPFVPTRVTQWAELGDIWDTAIRERYQA